MQNKYTQRAGEYRGESLAALFLSLATAGTGIWALTLTNDTTAVPTAAACFVFSGISALKSAFAHVSYEQEKTRALLLDNNIISYPDESPDAENHRPELGA